MGVSWKYCLQLCFPLKWSNVRQLIVRYQEIELQQKQHWNGRLAGGPCNLNKGVVFVGQLLNNRFEVTFSETSHLMLTSSCLRKRWKHKGMFKRYVIIWRVWKMLTLVYLKWRFFSYEILTRTGVRCNDIILWMFTILTYRALTLLLLSSCLFFARWRFWRISWNFWHVITFLIPSSPM